MIFVSNFSNIKEIQQGDYYTEKIDLHIHTNLSDGNHDINEIISLAKNKNVLQYL